MDRLKMQTENKADANFRKLAELFPNVVTETIDENGEVVRAIDKDMLLQEISAKVVEGRDERYQFTWPGKRKAILAANAPSTNTLRPCREDSVHFNTTENLYIEGDNLEVLKLLQENYLGKVKVIYVDPPYNTGNDFVYEDDFTETIDEYVGISGQYDADGNRMVQNIESNGRFHTDWLNMIYPRLKTAHSLLSDDGIIFISIDDNELVNMTKVCDEIFGRDNRIETIVWKNKYGAGAFTVGFISVHEYILVYSKKTITNITSELDAEGQKAYNKKDEKYSVRGGYMTQPLMTNSLGDRPNLQYDIEHNGVTIHPNKQWVGNKERLLAAIANNDVELNLQKDGSYSVRSKAYLKDENGKMRRGKPLSIMNGPFNQEGSKRIETLFSKKVFDFTKPVELIKYLVSLEVNNDPSNDFIVMDFFAGSSTTADAVMQLNASDNGKRKFIMIQIPEEVQAKTEAAKAGFKNICEIGKERIRQAAKQINKTYPDASFDDGFRVLKLDSSNMQQVWYTPNEFVAKDLFEATVDNVKSDRTAEDLLFQAILELDCPLSSKIETIQIQGKTIYNVAEGYLMACFEEGLTDGIISEIAQKFPYYFVMRDRSLSNDSVAVNFEQIFKSYSPDTKLKVF